MKVHRIANQKYTKTQVAELHIVIVLRTLLGYQNSMSGKKTKRKRESGQIPSKLDTVKLKMETINTRFIRY